ncbi:hypothetical protein GCM10011571_35250 [Marinithermofilum abyssi]|uniref:Uncharacterized protein n=1 Tax=Marinithermofilum abyssi TaxID=1571185 RepID=A0A8J2VKT7_9BACL|nr:hypothetical protein [Marinithermofilum abyssi]GGE30004.1 hypothetical protein GCM10011571_35250 [Marinithermofilum abyssi]
MAIAEETVSFRWPPGTPAEVKKEYYRLKEELGRNTSRRIAQYVIDGILRDLRGDKVYPVPLLREPTPEQRDWLYHELTISMMAKSLDSILQEPFVPFGRLNEKKEEGQKEDKPSALAEDIVRDMESSGLDFGD